MLLIFQGPSEVFWTPTPFSEHPAACLIEKDKSHSAFPRVSSFLEVIVASDPVSDTVPFVMAGYKYLSTVS